MLVRHVLLLLGFSVIGLQVLPEVSRRREMRAKGQWDATGSLGDTRSLVGLTRVKGLQLLAQVGG